MIYSPSPIAPTVWQGELDCVIGPFESRTVAQTFVSFRVEFGPAVAEHIYPEGSSWYVELRKLEWGVSHLDSV